nr:hypothetical protein [Tanacetum cinerariifolium]
MFPQLDSSLAIPSFLPGDDPIASLNKAMTFISIKIDDLDAFDSDCDEAPSARALLVANLSSYDSDVLLMVPISDTYQDNFMLDHCVQEMYYSEQPTFVHTSDFEIISDSNIISYDQYIKENESKVVQSTPSLEQKNAMIIFVIDEMSNQVAKYNALNLKNKNKIEKSFVDEYNEYLELKVKLSKKNGMVEKAVYNELSKRWKDVTISNLKKHIANMKENVVANCSESVNNSRVIAPRMYKLDLPPISSTLRKNKEVYENYLKVTKEHADTLCGIIEQARALEPSDNALDYASLRSNENREYQWEEPLKVVSRTPPAVVIALILVDTIGTPSSTSVDQDAPPASTSPTPEDSHERVLQQDVEGHEPPNA